MEPIPKKRKVLLDSPSLDESMIISSDEGENEQTINSLQKELISFVESTQSFEELFAENENRNLL